MPRQCLRHQSPRPPPLLQLQTEANQKGSGLFQLREFCMFRKRQRFCSCAKTAQTHQSRNRDGNSRRSASTTNTSFELPVVSPPAPPPIGTCFPEEYDHDDHLKEISMSFFDAENQIGNLQKIYNIHN